MRTKEEILKGDSEVYFLSKCQIDFKFFCERMLGMTDYGGIHDFQLKWFYLIQNNDRTVIEAPSGFSKTEIAGVAYTIWLVWNYPNLKVLLVSKTIKQAEGNILQRIKGYIDDNEYLKELVPPGNEKTWNKQEIRTTNKCWLVNVPYSINIKGYRADYILCDEADSYEDTSIYFEHVTSRVNPGGKICLISTPEGPTKLIGEIKSKQPKNYMFVKTVAIVDEHGKQKEEPLDEGISIWAERFSIEELMKKRDEMGENSFQKNYMCNVMTESSDAVFSLQAFVDSYDETIGFSDLIYEDAQYFIGADFAISKGPKADLDAYVVLEKRNDVLTVKHMETHKGFPHPSKLERLQYLYDKYQSKKTTRIIADESNMGTIIMNALRARGITVTPKNFYHAHRKKMLQTLANVFEGGTLIIPRSHKDHKALKHSNELLKQLLGFRREKSDKTGSELFSSHAAHDDIAISLAMAVEAATLMQKMSCVGMSRR